MMSAYGHHKMVHYYKARPHLLRKAPLRSVVSGEHTALQITDRAVATLGKTQNVSTFSIGPAKYFRTARSNDLQMSSASADGGQFVFTVPIHANERKRPVGSGKCFRTARSNDLQMSSASADGEQFVFTVFPSMQMVAMTQEGSEPPPKRRADPFASISAEGVTQSHAIAVFLVDFTRSKQAQ